MRNFFNYIISFSITHLFFAVFIFFGLGIFTEMNDEQSSFIYLYVLYLCVIATIVQALFFTVISFFYNIAGLVFFITALALELLVSNVQHAHVRARLRLCRCRSRSATTWRA